MDKTKTANLIKTLKDIFVTEERPVIKDQQPRLIKIKAMKKEKPTISKATYEEAPF